MLENVLAGKIADPNAGGDTVEFLTFKTAVLEKMLKGYKTALYHELKIDRIKDLEAALAAAENNKQRANLEKLIKETKKYFDAEMKRAEKYNTEISTFFEEESSMVDNFCEASVSVFAEMTRIILQATDVLPKDAAGKIIPSSFRPALLHESDKGNIFMGGKKYIIYY
jgi:hypothetical protein